MLKHKPGNWRESKSSYKAIISDLATDSEFLSECDLTGYGGYLVAESVPAQVRPLILAAPKMLDALERILVEGEVLAKENCHCDHEQNAACPYCEIVFLARQVVVEVRGEA